MNKHPAATISKQILAPMATYKSFVVDISAINAATTLNNSVFCTFPKSL